MTCPRCNRKTDSGRCQSNGAVWCFDCSLDLHDVAVREQKAAGTFVAPSGPITVLFGDWQAPPKERGQA